MTDEVDAIRREFGPQDLEPILAETRVSHTVSVQAMSSLEETRYLLAIAASTGFVAGVVGWVDVRRQDVSDAIANLRSARGGEHLVGIRHQVHDEPDPEWLLRPDVQRGLQQVGAAGLTYDLLVRTRELPAALETTRRHPDILFVIDHIAKPPIREGVVDDWARAMEPFAELGNVYCKLSGLVTEADWRSWRPDHLIPYVQRVLGWFGAKRVMFGSDWPVCLLAATYTEVMDALDHALGNLDAGVRSDIYGANAVAFYGLNLSG